MTVPVVHPSTGMLHMEDIRKFRRMLKGSFSSTCVVHSWAVVSGVFWRGACWVGVMVCSERVDLQLSPWTYVLVYSPKRLVQSRPRVRQRSQAVGREAVLSMSPRGRRQQYELSHSTCQKICRAQKPSELLKSQGGKGKQSLYLPKQLFELSTRKNCVGSEASLSLMFVNYLFQLFFFFFPCPK